MSKKHWFCFCYTGRSSDSSERGQTWANTFTGYPCKEVTVQMINENKANAGVDENATVVSVSYLGYMTRQEFVGDEVDKKLEGEG